jgi:fibrillarin-like pre-rRNA processing protein
MIKESSIFDVYQETGKKGKKIFTKSLVKGIDVYGERIVREKGNEYREWNPQRSKLCAAILKGVKNIFIRKGDVILYLGASTGTTPSHVSDLVGNEGLIFALDISARVLRQLVFLAEQRKNLVPILADCSQPLTYLHKVCMADVVYQDIAQSNQSDIFLRNCDLFLKKGGFAIISIKSRSIDIRKKPRQVYQEEREKIEKGLTIIDSKTLDPYEKDHCIFLCKKK